ncbi:MAG: chemotaxis protein CheA [Desulfobacteraceae bacterium]
MDTQVVQQIDDCLSRITEQMGGFCPEDMSGLNRMAEALDELIEISKGIGPDSLEQVSLACKEYLQKMQQDGIRDSVPMEEGVLLLQSIWRHIRKDKPFTFDYSDVLELLQARFSQESSMPEEEPGTGEESLPESAAFASFSEEDLEILSDFVSEAEDNLGTIEGNLIELEQDPSNMDTVNEIFRPFHTIKGVSGFLALNRINRLSHATENLLDSARSGEFTINRKAVDVILQSVDTLKSLVARVKQSTMEGAMLSDDDIHIEPVIQSLKQTHQALLEGTGDRLGEMLVDRGLVDSEAVEQALEAQKEHPDKKIGELLVDDRKVQPEQVASAVTEQAGARKQAESHVKVSTGKLDDLVDYAGEMVIAQSILKQKTANDPYLSQDVANLGMIVTRMQNIAMSMRMIPIKSTFMKMTRLVRDLSRKSGKRVELKMSGEETEIDRNMVDALYEPMVHMIRNAVDHGIESASERTGRGKAASAAVWLRAYHKGGYLIIEIEDDGKGLDKERILEKAESKGLITGDENFSDTRIYDLILQPGFSTAKEVTDVSGRGVGMDVVKEGIEKFRGRLAIGSEKGVGTKFMISLPLTLAIIDGMLVRVGEEKYVIPTIAVQKAFRPDRKDCYTVEGKGEMVKDRDGLIPLVRLGHVFNSETVSSSPWESLLVVAESKDDRRALLIDELLGKDEYVIKNLGGTLGDIEGLSGGAILPDGKVGLILDVQGIFEMVSDG